ncbi:hypothetical protein A3Q56_00948 [Intoshia linei]|uniref:PSP proline-rich domain-containing protein n=1 Tax=Intoshia linei TaxID=1819745 RepID=A0A177BAN7_9BILA|nr:hypothetical protein A3Q56_00948 [Intoshia linei]
MDVNAMFDIFDNPDLPVEIPVNVENNTNFDIKSTTQDEIETFKDIEIKNQDKMETSQIIRNEPQSIFELESKIFTDKVKCFYFDTIKQKKFTNTGVTIIYDNSYISRIIKKEVDRIFTSFKELETPKNDYDLKNTDHMIQYFKTFCIDKSTINEKETVLYKCTFTTPLSNNMPDVIEPLTSRFTVSCFNCDGPHHLAKCPQPLNKRRIKMNRQKDQESKDVIIHKNTRIQNNKFAPGVLSDNLRNALGLKKNEIPPYVFIMRNVGYPPGYLLDGKRKEVGSLLIYGNEDTDSKETKISKYGDQRISNEIRLEDLPPEHVIHYPGFNSAKSDVGGRSGIIAEKCSISEFDTSFKSTETRSTSNPTNSLDDKKYSIGESISFTDATVIPECEDKSEFSNVPTILEMREGIAEFEYSEEAVSVGSFKKLKDMIRNIRKKVTK